MPDIHHHTHSHHLGQYPDHLGLSYPEHIVEETHHSKHKTPALEESETIESDDLTGSEVPTDLHHHHHSSAAPL